MAGKPPLILTLLMEKKAFLFFNSLRKKHFPPPNFIDAHLTLFHALPSEDEIINTIRDSCREQACFELMITEVVSIGKGVAYKIECNELEQLHKTLQNKWQYFLSPQDRQKLWPHVTVQNKVPAEKAKELLNELKSSFAPFVSTATGLQLWEYLGGPWRHVEDFFFKEIQT